MTSKINELLDLMNENEKSVFLESLTSDELEVMLEDLEEAQAKKKDKMLARALFKKEDKDPCWDSHKMVGMKDKNGKKVPNCVPKKEEVEILPARQLLNSILEGRKPQEPKPGQKPSRAWLISQGHDVPERVFKPGGGRGRPAVQGTKAYERQQERMKAKETNGEQGSLATSSERPVITAQLAKAHSIGSKVTFADGKSHSLEDGHIQKFHAHLDAARTPIQKAELQQFADQSHENWMKLVNSPVKQHQGGKSSMVDHETYRR